MSTGHRVPRSVSRRILLVGAVCTLVLLLAMALLVGINARLHSDLYAATGAFAEEQRIADQISNAVMRQLVIASTPTPRRGADVHAEFRAAGEDAYEGMQRYLFRDLSADERLQLESMKEHHQRLEVAATRTFNLAARGAVGQAEASTDLMIRHALALQDAVDAFLRLREGDLERIRTRQAAYFRGMGVGLGALALLLVGSAVLLARYLHRRLAVPLAELSDAVTRVGVGDLAARAPTSDDGEPGGAERADELDQLAAAFNVMAHRIEKTQTVLRQSEEQFRLLFANNPLPMWVYDLDTLQFVEVNDAAVDHYGYSRDEFLSMRLSDIRPPEDVPRLVADVQAERPALSHSGEWRHRLKDGRIIDVEITSHTLAFGGRRAALVVAQDIAQRKRAEAQLHDLTQELEQRVALRTTELLASEERFRSLAVTANEGIVTADRRGCITYLNPAAERTFGYSAGEVLGQQLTVLMPERFQEPHRRGLARYLATGEAHVIGRTVELAGRRKDGTEFPLELSLASWHQDDEPAFAGIIRDITERKQIEEALQRSAADLEVANKELEAFSYSVSHDLRAPLRGIAGFSQALLEDYDDALDDTGRDYLRRLVAASGRMGVLIDDLLELSRVTRHELQPERVDLSALAQSVATELCQREPRSRVQVVIAPGLEARGDASLLRIALQNLLHNAWKFTGRHEQASIEFGTTERDGVRVYFVRDDGAGFDMRYAEQLFRPFHRLHRETEFPGTGIGLATVQRIVHRHDGRLWAEGAVEQGATFYFTLGEES